jgi:tetratricopeptide (TPR) repeat protein
MKYAMCERKLFLSLLMFLLLIVLGCKESNYDTIKEKPQDNQNFENLKYLMEMVEENPQDDYLSYRLADTYFKNNDVENAYISIKKALEYGQKSEYYFLFSQCLYKKGLYLDALDFIQKIDTAIIPKKDLYTLQSRILAANGKPKDAIVLLKELTNESPQDAEIWVILGEMYAAIPDTIKALAIFQKAYSLDSTLIQPIIYQATIEIHQSKFKEALLSLNKAFKYDTSNLRLIYLKGSAYSSLLQYDSALVYMKKLELVDSNNVDLIREIGKIYLKKNLLVSALPYLQKLHRLYPFNIENNCKLGYVLYKQNELEASLKCFQTVDSADVQFDFAKVYLKKIDFKLRQIQLEQKRDSLSAASKYYRYRDTIK